MRNVNLNILKFLESMNNFCLYLSNIGLEVSYQLSVISYQLSVISYQLSDVSFQFTENTSHLPPQRARSGLPCSPLPNS
ncbi:MAG: hypothetical protein ACKPGF_09525 [Microcystis panniformis]